MPREIRWLTSRTASAWHALELTVGGGPLVDADLAARLAPLAARLARFGQGLGSLSAGRLSEHLVPLAAQVDSPAALARQVLDKAVGPGRPARLDEELAALAGDLDETWLAWRPNLHQELELRAGPFLEQWEARGPGLLGELGVVTEPELIAERGDVVLVYPAGGGGGAAHSFYNLVRLEALLANPWAQFPEVLRLGWLWAQLQLDLPRYESSLVRPRQAWLAARALVPAVLAAGAEVELCRPGSESLAEVLTAWRLADPQVPHLAATLDTWWQTYRDSRPPWGLALVALDRLLAAEG